MGNINSQNGPMQTQPQMMGNLGLQPNNMFQQFEAVSNQFTFQSMNR